MKDITKCKGEGCPIREDCYRFTHFTQDEWEYYFLETPYINGNCEMYHGKNQESIFSQLKKYLNN